MLRLLVKWCATLKESQREQNIAKLLQYDKNYHWSKNRRTADACTHNFNICVKLHRPQPMQIDIPTTDYRLSGYRQSARRHSSAHSFNYYYYSIHILFPFSFFFFCFSVLPLLMRQAAEHRAKVRSHPTASPFITASSQPTMGKYYISESNSRRRSISDSSNRRIQKIS